MVAPLIGLALGLGGFGLQELGNKRKTREERASNLGVLASIVQGTPGDTLGGFSPQQQQQINIVSQSDPGQAITLARSFQTGNAQAQQQAFANANATSALQLQQQAAVQNQRRFDFDFGSAVFSRQQSEQKVADNQRALVDPAFAAEQSAKQLASGTGDGSYPVLDPVRGTFAQAFIPGTPQFQAAEGAITTTTQTLDDVTELRQSLRTFGATGDPASLQTRRVQSLTTSLQLQFKDLAALGVISETDFTQFILKVVPDATTVKEALVSNPEAIDQALVQFTTDIQRANAVALGNVAGWEGITDEVKQNAASAQAKANAQNTVAARELAAEQTQTRTREQILADAGIGATAFDDVVTAGLAPFLNAITGNAATAPAQARLDEIRAAGENAGLVDPGTLRQIGAGVIDNAGKALGVVGALLGGRFIAGGAAAR